MENSILFQFVEILALAVIMYMGRNKGLGRNRGQAPIGFVIYRQVSRSFCPINITPSIDIPYYTCYYTYKLMEVLPNAKEAYVDYR